MSTNPAQFLNLESEFTNPKLAQTVILPVPYEGGASHGKGAANGPRAILEVSRNFELYDEVYRKEIHTGGIATLAPADTSGDPRNAMENIRAEAAKWIKSGKFLVGLGGDHSVSFGLFGGAQEAHPDLACIQIDARPDLHNIYANDPLSHVCVMSRIRELKAQTLHLGIRSMSAAEAQRIQNEKIETIRMHEYYQKKVDVGRILATISERVYLTIDVGCMDWSVIRSTSAPEPGGFTWREMLDLLDIIFKDKNVVACDVMELAPKENDVNSVFAAARLVFKLIAMKHSIEHIGRMDGLVI
jgi:N1-aminopropylagmatine ureohydrolase